MQAKTAGYRFSPGNMTAIAAAYFERRMRESERLT
jgi:hypothetical protein